MKVERIQAAKFTRVGFTLIEIMVVVAIIVLLIAFLIPAIGAARNSAHRTATTAQMRTIAMGCDNYYTMFNAYPGAISEANYDGGTNVQFSSSQALVLALTRAFCYRDPSTFTTSAFLGTEQINTLNFWVANQASVTPRDYSTGPSDNNGNVIGKSYEPFLNPTPPQLSPSVGILTPPANNPALVPTFVDNAYGNESLPILYYRAARKYDPSVNNGAGNMVPVSQNSGNFSAFYTASNDWLVSQVPATSGLSKFTANGTTNTANLSNELFNKDAGGNYVAKGAYLLISAGQDRIYGADPKNNVDDIIIAGGN